MNALTGLGIQTSRITRAPRVFAFCFGWLALGFPTSTLAEPAACHFVEYDRRAYTVCEIDLRRQVVKLFWRRAGGEPYSYLSAIPQSLDGHSGRLRFAMNAGMYHPDYRPVGLYIEGGRQLANANMKAGPGNFHMKPNGVFYVSGEIAGILETAVFLRQKPQADFATQSGPMLVINNRLHPRFSRSGGSQKRRNGVGVRDPSTLAFAISEAEVSFGEFARLFRDKLKCKDALFLDGGSASSLYSRETRHSGNLLPLGPILGVYDREN